MRPKISSKNLFFCFIVLFYLSLCVFAERLSFRTFTSSDGLGQDTVNKIVRDSRGFLWFCTGEGLSRFDGFRFKNYTQDDGLPHRNIYDFLETKDGDLLVATNGGLAVLNPLGKPFRWNTFEGRLEQTSNEPPLFKTFITPDAQKNDKQTKAIVSLAMLGDGSIFASGVNALFRVVKTGDEWSFEKVEFAGWNDKPHTFNGLFADSKNNLWIGTSFSIYLRTSGGEIVKLAAHGGGSFFEDGGGKIWADSSGDEVGISIFTYENAGAPPQLMRLYTKNDGLYVNRFTNAIAQTADGKIFVTSNGKLYEFLPNAPDGELKFRLLENRVNTAVSDVSGNIWFGLNGKGVGRYSPNSFEIFTGQDGIPGEMIRSIFGNKKGEIFLTSGTQSLTRIAGGKIETVQPRGSAPRSWLDTYLDLQSPDGEFWVPTINGLYRYPKVENFADLARTPPRRVYRNFAGLEVKVVDTLYEDSRGDVWISAANYGDSLIRWERATDAFHRYTPADGLPVSSGAVSFGEDRAGNVWIGFYYGQVMRFKNGKFRSLTDEKVISRNFVHQMLTDRQGRLWLATSSRGVYRIENPDGDELAVTNLSTAESLSSNQVLCLTEDKLGRIYLGTGRGLNRLETDPQRVKVFTQNNGLPGNTISKCYADVNGNLWFSSNESLIKFVPTVESPAPPLPVYIDGISINGQSRKVSELGDREIKNLELGADERQIQISFFAISFHKGETVRYQYRLGEQPWSEPNEQRSVNFNLSAGNYKFAVRAVNADGIVSEGTASVLFTIAPPFWRTREFIAAVILIAALAVFLLDRYRVAKTRQVETALAKSLESERIARESELRFRTLAETASDAIITIDVESRIVFVNEAVEKVFGWKADELIGENLTILMPDKFQERHQTGLSHYVSTGAKNILWTGLELTGRHRSGVEIPIEISFGEFELEGKRYFTGVARDISERRRAEEALRKAREERLAELEKVRTRIATDLHDDIGSSLTQIAVLTEVARASAILETVKTPLERISDVSNELVDAMADIVWAINPKKDNLRELVLRMRRFASDVLSARDIEFELEAPEELGQVSLGANIRREVFSIFKEAINNIVRHAGATEVFINFEANENNLRLEIKDNGRGFDVAEILSENFSPEKGGNGLVNMRRRARDLGGNCEITSRANATEIKLEIPLYLAQTGDDIHITQANGRSAAIYTDSDGEGGNGLH
jgi:PAS domain S-box-containing protein